MRRIIRNSDYLDTRDESMVQNSLYSQKDDTGSSCCSIAANEITSAIKSSSDRVINTISDLGSKFNGLDNLVSSMSNGSMFSPLENRKRFSGKEGSGVKTLSKSTEDMREKSPLEIRNSLDNGDNMGYMQTLSSIASPRRLAPSKESIALNDMSKTMKDISRSESTRNNTLDKIFKLLDDKLDAVIASMAGEGDGGNYGPEIDLDLPDRKNKGRGRSRGGRSRPTKPGTKPNIKPRAPRGGRFGMLKGGAGAAAGILGAVAAYGELSHFAINETAEGMAKSYNIPKEEAQQRVAEMYNQGDMDYNGEIGEGIEDLTERINAPEKKSTPVVTSTATPATSPSTKLVSTSNIPTATQSSSNVSADQETTTTPTRYRGSTQSSTAPVIEVKSSNITPRQTESGRDESEDIARETIIQTSLIREGVNVLKDIRRYFDNKKIEDTFKEIEEGSARYSKTSTGSSGASLSENSPSGAPSASALPVEGMGAGGMGGPGGAPGGLPSGPGEPGVPDAGGGGGGAANPSVQGYLSIMQKNAQGSTYSQPNRQGAHSYDCSSFVSRSLQEAGFDISPSNTTSSLPGALRKIGFQYTAMPIPSGLTTAPSQLQAGDILLNPGHHVETYAGNNQIVGAHSSSSGVSLKKFYSTGYPGFWRLGGGAAPVNPAGGPGTSTGAMNPSAAPAGVPGEPGAGGPGGTGGPTGAAGPGGTGAPGTGGPTATPGGLPTGGTGSGPGGMPQPYSGASGATGAPSGGTSTGAMAPSTAPAGSFGTLLSKYETGGKGTSQITNSKGDKGGASYGKFQLSHKMGSLKEFMSTLQRNDPQAYAQLAPLWGSAGQGGSGAFGQKWKELAAQGRLQKSEDDYARNTYVKGGMSRLKDKALVERIKANPALQEVFLSTAVQHGAGGGASIWNSSVSGNMSDEEIIKRIYAERGRTNANGTLAHFSGSSRDIQRGVASRFKNEVNDALALNAQFKSGNYTGQVPGGKLNTSAQGMDPDVGRFSPDAGGGGGAPSGGPGGSGELGGGVSGGGGGAGSTIPSFINDITLMALQTQLMYDQ